VISTATVLDVQFVLEAGYELQSVFDDYLVVERLGGSQQSRVRKIVADPQVRQQKMIPMAGVAALVRRSGVLSQPHKSDSTSSAPSGRAFCALPLPVTTGLPVHVNAQFELSANRSVLFFVLLPILSLITQIVFLPIRSQTRCLVGLRHVW